MNNASDTSFISGLVASDILRRASPSLTEVLGNNHRCVPSSGVDAAISFQIRPLSRVYSNFTGLVTSIESHVIACSVAMGQDSPPLGWFKVRPVIANSSEISYTSGSSYLDTRTVIVSETSHATFQT